MNLLALFKSNMDLTPGLGVLAFPNTFRRPKARGICVSSLNLKKAKAVKLAAAQSHFSDDLLQTYLNRSKHLAFRTFTSVFFGNQCFLKCPAEVLQSNLLSLQGEDKK